MKGYRYLSPAAEEMVEASQFYELRSVGLGVDFLDDVQRVVDTLRTQPLLGEDIEGGLRKAVLHRFPFTIIYSPEPEEILIVAVAHQRRRPGYWEDRTDR